MRYAKIPLALVGKIRGNDLLVYLVLAGHANDTKHSFPGVETICKEARIKDDSAVRKSLRQLKERGYVVDTERRDPKYRTKVYYLPHHPNPPKLGKFARENSTHSR